MLVLMTPLSSDSFKGPNWSAGTTIPTAFRVRIPMTMFKPPSANPKNEATISEERSRMLTARISPPAIMILILNAHVSLSPHSLRLGRTVASRELRDLSEHTFHLLPSQNRPMILPLETLEWQ